MMPAALERGEKRVQLRLRLVRERLGRREVGPVRACDRGDRRALTRERFELDLDRQVAVDVIGGRPTGALVPGGDVRDDLRSTVS
jgi:hypothetical protein